MEFIERTDLIIKLNREDMKQLQTEFEEEMALDDTTPKMIMAIYNRLDLLDTRARKYE